MADGTTTTAQILQYTATFFAETLSRPDLRRHVFSAFLNRRPAQLITKSLNFASQTIENAISTTSSSIRCSSLRLVEKTLSSDNTAHSSFLLSLAYSLSHRPLDASLSLLDVFCADPSLCRREIAPFLFEEMFLVYFLPVLEWYNYHRSNILASNPSFNVDSGGNNSDEQLSIVSYSTTLLSKMSGDQASALKDLERDYEDLLDENCRIFAGYFKEVLQNKDEENPPPIVLCRRSNIEKGGEIVVCSIDEEKKMDSQEFSSTNRRYNVMLLYIMQLALTFYICW